MNYEKINLKVVIKGETYAIPVSVAMSPDGDKLILVFKQGEAGGAKELRNQLVNDGERLE